MQSYLSFQSLNPIFFYSVTFTHRGINGIVPEYSRIHWCTSRIGCLWPLSPPQPSHIHFSLGGKTHIPFGGLCQACCHQIAGQCMEWGWVLPFLSILSYCHSHSWMSHTYSSPFLNMQGEGILKQSLEHAWHVVCFCNFSKQWIVLCSYLFSLVSLLLPCSLKRFSSSTWKPAKVRKTEAKLKRNGCPSCAKNVLMENGDSKNVQVEHSTANFYQEYWVLKDLGKME